MSGSESETRANTPCAPGLERLQAPRRHLLDLQVPRRDRIAVRVMRRIAELGGDQLLELLGEHVLQHLRLRVHTIPRDAEALDQVQLEQPMVAHHLERDASPVVGQRHAAVGRVVDETELAEPFDHARRGRRRDAEPLGDRVRADATPSVVAI